MTREEFMSLSPTDLYIYLTGRVLYDAVQLDNQQKIDTVLSCFDADARHCLCIGLSALRAIGDTKYSNALKTAMAKTLYEYFNKEAQA